MTYRVIHKDFQWVPAGTASRTTDLVNVAQIGADLNPGAGHIITVRVDGDFETGTSSSGIINGEIKVFWYDGTTTHDWPRGTTGMSGRCRTDNLDTANKVIVGAVVKEIARASDFGGNLSAIRLEFINHDTSTFIGMEFNATVRIEPGTVSGG